MAFDQPNCCWQDYCPRGLWSELLQQKKHYLTCLSSDKLRETEALSNWSNEILSTEIFSIYPLISRAVSTGTLSIWPLIRTTAINKNIVQLPLDQLNFCQQKLFPTGNWFLLKEFWNCVLLRQTIITSNNVQLALIRKLL